MTFKLGDRVEVIAPYNDAKEFGGMAGTVIFVPKTDTGFYLVDLDEEDIEEFLYEELELE
jgi:hypothetical protein